MMTSASGQGFDMSQAQSGAMNPGALRARIEGSFDTLITTIEHAYEGDAAGIKLAFSNAITAR